MPDIEPGGALLAPRDGATSSLASATLPGFGYGFWFGVTRIVPLKNARSIAHSSNTTFSFVKFAPSATRTSTSVPPVEVPTVKSEDVKPLWPRFRP
jgi:hypothetical protein